MITAIVIILYAVVYAADYLPLLKQPGAKGKIVYGVMLLVSFCVLILYTYNIQIPSPATPIIDAINALFPKIKQ